MWLKQIAVTSLAVMGCHCTSARPAFEPARPPAVPLAVRSPYLNAWLQGGSGGVLPGSWPRFWTGHVLGWQGFVSVDGVTYNWLGAAPGPEPVNQTSLTYTSTQSIFTFDVAGKVTMTVNFLSPVYPDDVARQSLQFSYISIKVMSADGKSHQVRTYMDVTGEWASGDINEIVNWETNTTNGIIYHKFFRKNQVEFGEAHEVASWGHWYLSTKAGKDIGPDTEVRNQFVKKSVLKNTKDTSYRAVQENWPVFALAHDLGNITKDGIVERVLTLGIIQDRVIQFAGQSGKLEPVPGLWSSYYPNETAAVVSFYHDYAHALDVSARLDEQIRRDSEAAAGREYALITTLAVRQTFGALQYAGTPAKPYIFLKEISSNSDIQTVDVIFPAYPIFLYLNATLGRFLLEPLFENQESGAYPNAYAEHDLGTFPIAKGYPAGDDEPMPLEECGNMIIMALAYAQRTGDNEYLAKHYKLLSQWAEFLVNDSLIPASQLSTDDFAGTLANQTNLAIKGIIGLKAMSQIAQLTNNKDVFGDVADRYLQEWKRFAINAKASPPHTTLSYGNSNSHGLLYNIYADKLLNLQFIDQAIYDMQSDFYLTVANEYAVPLDSRHNWTKSDWEMFAAAVAKPETRAMFISKLARWISDTTTDRAMTDLFDSVTGAYPANGPVFVARPVVGAVFSILALQEAPPY
ncbi:glutaminase-like protein [Thermochaetoides thermophila DSM 1495]|uniref:Glutaminase-like protein n=1 Tax=Chaetomium thermophilum (strain DSM 1495 / CBS 144.50 / IMI 039719) TaxID=759272 RepID=G0S9K6_CHATD|nr:glutaminase-like protein [Thermochaetoides thermophila DSM 1495]EGS20117.1 glutaminase-like protein [Thermochaetoides thermophila DSM 1495]